MAYEQLPQSPDDAKDLDRDIWDQKDITEQDENETIKDTEGQPAADETGMRLSKRKQAGRYIRNIRYRANRKAGFLIICRVCIRIGSSIMPPM
mgnify:CR=1 FL=1